jgi:transposase
MARKTYNDEFKIAAAKLVREQGYSVKKAASSLGVDPGSIRTWARRFAPAPTAPAADATPEQLHRENLRLREENRRLLMEREILKKATAFFAKELT